MSKQPPPAPTASAIGPCPTIIQIVGRPGTGSLPRTIAPPGHPQNNLMQQILYFISIGVGRFRILGEGGGGKRLEYWGAKGGQILSRHITS